MSSISNCEIGTGWYAEQVFNHLVKNYSNKTFSIIDLKEDPILTSCINISPPKNIISTTPKKKKSSDSKAQKASSPINPDKCQCRVWNHGYGGQCSFYKKEGDFCKRHASEALKIYEEHCTNQDADLDLSDKIDALRKITEKGTLLHGWMGIITDERPTNPTKRDGSSLTWIDSKPIRKKNISPPKTIKKTLEKDTSDYDNISVDTGSGVGDLPERSEAIKQESSQDDEDKQEPPTQVVPSDDENDCEETSAASDEEVDKEDDEEGETDPGNFDDFNLSDEDSDEE